MGLLKEFDLFIFDWDGTIIRLYTHVRLYGRLIGSIVRREQEVSFYDHDFEPPEETASKENYIVSSILNFFVEHFSKPHLNKYAIETLERLRHEGKKIGILTNGSKDRVVKKIKKAGIEEYFDIVVSTKDLHAAKPNPAGLKVIIKALNVHSERCIYVGDKTSDILTAKYAKVRSCGIADGFDSYKRLESVKPDYIFKSMEGFYKAL